MLPINVSELKGKTLTKVTCLRDEKVIFECEDNTKYEMYHTQDCCESVYLEDKCGDWEDLLKYPTT